MRDKIVFDIETKDTFADVGGQENLEKLSASLLCIYSYNNDSFTCFREGTFEDAAKIFQEAGLIIGFSSNRFDIPVMNKYFKFNLKAIPSLDLLEVVERSFGRRVGLDLLAKTNLGIGKTNKSLDAIRFYREGDWDALERYCTQDVRVTRDLYDLVKRQGYLMIPDRLTENLHKVPLMIEDTIVEVNTLF